MTRLLLVLKYHFDRGRYYQGYIQQLIVLLVFVNTSDILSAMVSKNYWLLPLFFIFYLTICVAIGYIDYKLQIREKEQRLLIERSPKQEKLYKDIDQLLDICHTIARRLH